MRRVLQTRVGAPAGNCTAACYASIFEVQLDAVPDPRWPDNIPWSEGQDKTLTTRGRLAREAYSNPFQDFVGSYGLFPLTVGFDNQKIFVPGYSIGIVTNPRGLPHSVV